MGLEKKEKGDPSWVNGGRVSQRRSVESSTTGYWDFLEEIEAPMWVDLTLEAELMVEDIDDAWFRVSHLIHQMSSRQLKSSLRAKDKASSPKLGCKSPKLPDSVSRSRGKHYKGRKWMGNQCGGALVNEQHPVRKLGGKSLGMAASLSTSGGNSSSTITTNSSMRKTKCNIKLSSMAESSSTGSVASKHPSLRSKANIHGPRNNSSAKSVSSKVLSNISNMGSTFNPRGSGTASNSVRQEIGGEKRQQERKSTSSKSSVGSSHSLGSKLENIKSILILKEEKCMESKISMRPVSVLKVSGSQISNRNSNSRPLRKGIDVKFTDQGSKTKVLDSTVSRKPLSLLNGSMPVKNRAGTQPALNAGARNLKSVASSNKENTTEGKTQNFRTIKHRESMMTGKGLSKFKGKANGEKKERNLHAYDFFS